jgi:hypothetical protein
VLPKIERTPNITESREEQDVELLVGRERYRMPMARRFQVPGADQTGFGIVPSSICVGGLVLHAEYDRQVL